MALPEVCLYSRSDEKGSQSNGLLSWIRAGEFFCFDLTGTSCMISSHSLLGIVFALCPFLDCKLHEDSDWDWEPPEPSALCLWAAHTQQTPEEVP